MPREDVIVAEILDYLNKLPNCVAEKLQGTALSSGKADINCCYKGHSLRIEVKTPDHGNKASKKQKINLRRWEKAGAYCCVAYSLKDVTDLLAKIDGKSENNEIKQLQAIVKRIGQKIEAFGNGYMEFTKSSCGENVSVDYDEKDGKILDLY